MTTDQNNMDFPSKEHLCELLKRSDVVTCEPDASDLSKLSQLSQMRWATIKFSGGSPDLRVVLKASRGGDDRSKTYGLAREALFYKDWRTVVSKGSRTPEKTSELIESFLPTIFFSEGDMSTAAKRILMEDFSNCVQAGYFFGPLNCNNWGKDLAEETAGEAFTGSAGKTLTAEEVTGLCFSAAAKLHAGFWDCEKLLAKKSETTTTAPEFEWLRGASWLGGEGRDTWQASQNGVMKFWSGLRAKIAAGESAVNFDPAMVELMDAAVAKIDWDVYRAEAESRPFTVTHGDFHPANFMVRPKREGSSAAVHSLALLDWELVGVGSGPQDLGQFVISHVDPVERGRFEEAAVRKYYEELRQINSGVTMTWEQCWSEYVQGGLGRWIWFVPMLCTFCPPKMGQFFHDQVLAFANAHGVTKDNVPMPRA